MQCLQELWLLVVSCSTLHSTSSCAAEATRAGQHLHLQAEAASIAITYNHIITSRKIRSETDLNPSVGVLTLGRAQAQQQHAVRARQGEHPEGVLPDALPGQAGVLQQAELSVWLCRLMQHTCRYRTAPPGVHDW